jgi:Rps23 Pro-64 3,4-dihydroxylase Tpa1-like proline 4-hydroxylase
MDTLIRRDEVRTIIGQYQSDWSHCGASPWLYPPGSALSIHVDGHRFAGAFVYFAHREWKLRWGGLLIVFDGDDSELAMNILDDDQDDRSVSPQGIATVILPRPNRLVFLAPHSPHLVTEISEKAGDNLRVTIAGFFNRLESEHASPGALVD